MNEKYSFRYHVEKFWQIMEIYSFGFCPYFYGAWVFFPSALLYQERLLLGS